MECCICNESIDGFGHNPFPVSKNPKDRCCDDCNTNVVIAMRIMDYLK